MKAKYLILGFLFIVTFYIGYNIGVNSVDLKNVDISNSKTVTDVKGNTYRVDYFVSVTSEDAVQLIHVDGESWWLGFDELADCIWEGEFD